MGRRDATGRSPTRDHRGIAGKSQRRLRRDGHADAPAGPVRRPRDACRRRPLRGLLPARLPRMRPARCATSYDGSFERFWDDFRVRPAFSKDGRRRARSTTGAWPPATRPTPTAPCASRSTSRPASCIPEVWERWLAWDPVRMAASTRDALRRCGRSTSTPGRATSTTSTSARRRSAAPRRRRRRRRRSSSCSTRTHAAIEYRYPIAMRYLAERIAP